MIFTKCETGSVYVYTATTKTATYKISRNGSRFILAVYAGSLTHTHLSKPQTLASCKAEAEVYDAAARTAKTAPVLEPAPLETEEPIMTDEQEAELDALDAATLTHPEAVADKLLQEEATISTPTAAVVAKITASYPNIGINDSGKMVTTKPATGLVGALKAGMAPKPDHGTAPHVIVEARAGTGKTTTLVEGLKFMKGMPTRITPSVQQKAVWETLALSRDARTVAFVAFNKTIANELKAKVPAGCDAMTMHGMGFKAVRKAYPDVKVEEYRVRNIIGRLLQRDTREILKNDPLLLQATERIVGLVKMNLTPLDIYDESERPGVYAKLDEICDHYEINLNEEEVAFSESRGYSRPVRGKSYRNQVFDLVIRVMEQCKDVTHDGAIDFDDMVWLPVALGLPAFRYDLLLVDEAQDLNRCQQELAKKCGRRLVFCGDCRQAIYGFAGADDESLPNLYTALSKTGQGCVTVPLTVTRRCGKAIVAEACKIVPDFAALDTNPEGKVSTSRYRLEQGQTGITYHGQVQDNDLVICRVNAPLVAECFRFLRMGRKANILGRDIGKGLVSLITRMNADSIPQLVTRLSNWVDAEEAKERAKKNPSESKLIGLQDKMDTIVTFTEGMATVDEVVNRINSIFAENDGAKGIRLSSIHKSKGLEATRVFLLQPKGATVPHPMAKSEWQWKQEMNCLYIALTRAIEELVYVS